MLIVTELQKYCAQERPYAKIVIKYRKHQKEVNL